MCGFGALHFLRNSAPKLRAVAFLLCTPAAVNAWTILIGRPAEDFGDDRGRAVAVDDHRNVVPVGALQRNAPEFPNADNNDFAIVKLDEPTGAENWQSTFDSLGGVSDFAEAVAVHAYEDVVVASFLCSAGSSLLGSRSALLTSQSLASQALKGRLSGCGISRIRQR